MTVNKIPLDPVNYQFDSRLAITNIHPYWLIQLKARQSNCGLV